MRVGLVIYGSLDTLSGGYLYDRMLVRQLLTDGHQVEILSLPWRSYGAHLADNFDSRWLRRLAASRVDLLIQDELNHPSLLLANHLRLACPVVSLVHHLRSSELDHPRRLRALYRQVERFYLNRVGAFLCNSETTQRSVEALVHHPKQHYVAYPAADHLAAGAGDGDLAALAARARQDGPLRLLFAGNLSRRKGLHNVLQALELLPAGCWRLTVVGRMDVDMGYTQQIERRCRTLPQGSVIFCGRVSDDELVRQYRSHHLFVLPSYEGFGIVYLEAMRFGLPVVAATAGAAHEIVTPGENGFLVAPDDAAALAACVGDLQVNRERLLAMSWAAQQRYARHPTWQQSMAGATAWLAALSGGNL